MMLTSNLVASPPQPMQGARSASTRAWLNSRAWIGCGSQSGSGRAPGSSRRDVAGVAAVLAVQAARPGHDVPLPLWRRAAARRRGGGCGRWRRSPGPQSRWGRRRVRGRPAPAPGSAHLVRRSRLVPPAWCGPAIRSARARPGAGGRRRWACERRRRRVRRRLAGARMRCGWCAAGRCGPRSSAAPALPAARPGAGRRTAGRPAGRGRR
jgi:hypothetical protein